MQRRHRGMEPCPKMQQHHDTAKLLIDLLARVVRVEAKVKDVVEKGTDTQAAGPRHLNIGAGPAGKNSEGGSKGEGDGRKTDRHGSKGENPGAGSGEVEGRVKQKSIYTSGAMTIGVGSAGEGRTGLDRRPKVLAQSTSPKYCEVL
jgi:hypothetical protein